MDKENSPLPKGIKIFLIIFVIGLIGIVYIDFISIPKRNREYQASCYWFAFSLSSQKDGYTRDLFYSCIERNGSVNNVERCWKIHSPETINFFYDMEKCPSNLYEGIIFK